MAEMRRRWMKPARRSPTSLDLSVCGWFFFFFITAAIWIIFWCNVLINYYWLKKKMMNNGNCIMWSLRVKWEWRTEQRGLGREEEDFWTER
jgi:hypothetical protein